VTQNVRKTRADEDLGELIVSIDAHGLLQSLIVQPGKRDRFAVIDQGKTVADVAARFNVTEQLVRQRLKLGRLSPTILKAYREDVIDLAQAQAFTRNDASSRGTRVQGNRCNGVRR
jgi:ParB-like chromosome segregation protein Spo0J